MGAEKIRANKVSSVEKPTTGKNKSVDRTVSEVRRSRGSALVAHRSERNALSVQRVRGLGSLR